MLTKSDIAEIKQKISVLQTRSSRWRLGYREDTHSWVIKIQVNKEVKTVETLPEGATHKAALLAIRRVVENWGTRASFLELSDLIMVLMNLVEYIQEVGNRPQRLRR